MMAIVAKWVISASALILVVLLLRLLLGRRISAGLRYGLWAVVLARLLVPVSFLSLTVSIPQLPEWTPPDTMEEESIYILPVSSVPVEESGVRAGEAGALYDPNSFGYPRLEDEGQTITRYAERISLLELLGWLWIAGAAVMGAALAASNLHFGMRLNRVRKPLEGTNAPIPVYTAPGLPSPCLAGLLCPAVYVTMEAADNPVMLRHILAHELTHYNHRDHLWSVLRGIALAIHWWNPLVWLAVVCSRKDSELACDAGALERLGSNERTAYGETLLALVTAKAGPADLLRFSTTMTGGRRSLKERMRRIICQPKQLVSALIAVIFVMTLSSLAAFGQAKEPEAPGISKEAPDAPASRPDGAWRTAQITLSEDGVPHINYTYGDTVESMDGEPIPAPQAWAGQNESAVLAGSPEVWAKLVSPNDGWLVACYGQEDAVRADTYVYKTEDGGINWTETAAPGTNWHISDVGFLSADRLILGQRRMVGAPCFITRDGGKSWEEVKLSEDMQVLDIEILTDANVIYMDIGAYEGDPRAFSMISFDMGDTWTDGLAWYRRAVQADLDHDGLTDLLTLRKITNTGLELWHLQFTPFCMDSPTWTDEAGSVHVGWTSFFLCRLDGEDYLLQYTPWMGGGACDYRYKLFYLTPEGGEVVVRENSVEFDLIFSSDYTNRHRFDPEAIAEFMGEVNTLLGNSALLILTDENLKATFTQEGRLYDSLWWLDGQDERLSLLENLENFAQYAQDHPDGTWSSLEDLLQSLTEEDVTGLPGDDNAVLVRCLRSAERGSRFYDWGSYNDAYLGHSDILGESDVLLVNLADGVTLNLFNLNKTGHVLMILETPDGAVSAFYEAPELYSFMLDGFDGDN